MPFNGPRTAIESVLRKLGIEPSERTYEGDQDAEYTACRADELPRYYLLYKEGDLTSDERAVLCCFLLESLNDHVQMGVPHPLQGDVIETLFAAGELHSAELAYWMNTSDPDEENWWPLTEGTAGAQ